MRYDGGKLFDQRGADDNVLRCDDIDSIGKRLTDKVGVEQRDDAADARYPKPDSNILGAIRHQQADDIAKR